jgi:hypothetical protein
MNAHQGGKTVRDFVREVESVAKKFPDVAERQLIQIFWDGVEQYIRVKWLDKGLSPEDDSLKRLIKWVLRFERWTTVESTTGCPASATGRTIVRRASGRRQRIAATPWKWIRALAEGIEIPRHPGRALPKGKFLLVSPDMQIGLLQTLKIVRIQGRRGVRTTMP